LASIVQFLPWSLQAIHTLERGEQAAFISLGLQLQLPLPSFVQV
jgi:hypothetical protein